MPGKHVWVGGAPIPWTSSVLDPIGLLLQGELSSIILPWPHLCWPLLPLWLLVISFFSCYI